MTYPIQSWTGLEKMWPRFDQGIVCRIGRGWIITIIAAALLSFATKVTIARNTYGSLDALIWENDLRELRQDGALDLYSNGTVVRLPGLAGHHEVFNHPPFMLRMLLGWDYLSQISGLPLRFWLRATCGVADLTSILLLGCMMLRFQARIHPANLLLTALSPISLMISGFHGNVDPIMTALALLSIHLSEIGSAWLAGMAMGMALNIKIVPLIFIPAILLSLGGRKWIGFLAAALGVFLVGSLPIIVQHPLLLWDHVFGYNPQSGIWGISLLVYVMASEASFNTYARFFKLPLLGLLALLPIWLNVYRRKPDLALQCGLLIFIFLALTPGFGVQYLVWGVPWVCLLTVRQALAFHAAGSLVLFSYYARAAGGFPWYLAYSGKSVWCGSLILLAFLCWLIVCRLAFCFLRNLATGAHSVADVAGMSVNKPRVFAKLSKETC